MLGCCPSCHARHGLDAFVANAEMRRALMRLAEFGGALEVATVIYLGCFNPPRRSLSPGRVVRLLDELDECVQTGRIRRKGRDWTVTRAQWTEALGIVIARRDAGKLELPLKNHNYLYEVAVGLADKAEAAAERTVEAERRAGRGPERRNDGPAVDHYETLIAEARRLGVDRDHNGLVKRLPELAEAVRRARLQEGLGETDTETPVRGEFGRPGAAPAPSSDPGAPSPSGG